MRSGAKVAVIGGVFAVVASGVGYGGYNLYNGLTGGDAATTKSAAAEKRTGPPSAEEIDETAKDFLAAWARGDAPAAAQLTNSAVEAQPLLAGYREQAHVSKAVITPGKAVGASVPFTVNATVSFEGQSKPWSYSSKLTVVRGLTTGKALVDWAPAVVHPKLTKTTSLKTDQASVPPIKAVDHEGRELTKEKYPSLGAVLDALRKKYGEKAGGTAGIELVVTSTDQAVADQTLLTLRKGKEGTLTTTLDAEVQAAAEQAVKKYSQASLVAVKPSTGEIRAVANSPADGYNAAMMGAQAPGSTMKIVTAAMMMDQGVVSGPSAKVECPSSVPWEGRPFHNLEDFSIPNGTFQDSFRRSCNTAFIKAVKPLNEKNVAGTALGETARKYFGIGLDWQTGAVSVDGSVPESTGSETAASVHRPGQGHDERAEHGVHHSDREERRISAAGDRVAVPRRPRAGHRPAAAGSDRLGAAADDARDRARAARDRPRWRLSAATRAPRRARPRSTVRASPTAGSPRTRVTWPPPRWCSPVATAATPRARWSPRCSTPAELSAAGRRERKRNSRGPYSYR